MPYRKNTEADSLFSRDSSGSGFLNQEQQAILEAAVKEKQRNQEQTNFHTEQPHSLRQTPQSMTPTQRDRASRARIDKLHGKPKKHGAGGKYNWGGSLECDGDSGVQDPNDPNYDSEIEIVDKVYLHESATTHNTYTKQAIAVVLKEYLLTGNQLEAIASLQSALRSVEGSWIVKKLVTLSMDHRDKERELASQLISAMYSTVLPGPELEQGFNLLLEAVGDLLLDVPNATDILARFIARAIVDDVLPPSFLSKHPTVGEKAGDETLQKAGSFLKAPHAAQRLQECWGTSDTTYDQIVEKIRDLINEYLSSTDLQEAQMCVSKLNTPLALHELVKQAIVKAISHTCQNHLVILIDHLYSVGLLSQDQLVKGFRRVHVHLNDLALDLPNAKAGFDSLCQVAEKRGWFALSALKDQRDSAPSSLTALSRVKTSGTGVQAFKKAVKSALREYFSSNDANEFRARLAELDQPGLHSLAVKQMLQMGLEGKDREREMVARLLLDLRDLISPDQLGLGFKRVLDSAEDLILDNPTTPHHLSIFLGRVIVDERLPPVFLTAALGALRNKSLGVDIIQATGNLLKQRHAYERFQTYWNAQSSLEDIRSQIHGLVKDFLKTGNEAEASRWWRDLSVPFFSHQLVYEILLADFDNPSSHDKLFKLLDRLLKSGEISETQFDMGFDRVEHQMSDLKLDFPTAPEHFSKCKVEAENRHWLLPSSQNGIGHGYV